MLLFPNIQLKGYSHKYVIALVPYIGFEELLD